MEINKKQMMAGLVLIAAMLAWIGYLMVDSQKLAMQLLLGLLMGYVLSRGRFGFAGGIRRIYMRGEGSLSKALLMMLSVTLVAFTAYQWYCASQGALPATIASETDAIIPGTQNVQAINLALMAGAFLFGSGMIFSGGCASGSLTDAGEGEGRSWWTLIFFILAAAPGEWARAVFDESSLGKLKAKVYLPDQFGYLGALLISLALVAVLYMIIQNYENKRKQAGTYLPMESDWEDFEKPLSEEVKGGFWSYRTYHALFVERWSFRVTGLIFAVLAITVLIMTGKAWGVTSAFTETDIAIFQSLGMKFENPKLVEIANEVSEKGLFGIGGVLRNIGLILGATITFLMAGRFKFNWRLSRKELIDYTIGGLLLGFGARLAKGCNAGALYSGISTFSLSGWVFLIFMWLGAVVALKMLVKRSWEK